MVFLVDLFLICYTETFIQIKFTNLIKIEINEKMRVLYWNYMMSERPFRI